MIERIFTIHDAILSLLPTAEVVVRNGTDVEWHVPPQSPFTDQQLADELSRLKSLYVQQKYQRQRKQAYPNIGEQLDMLWHALDQGKLDKTSDFYTTLAAVKAQYPKGDAQ